MVAPTNGWAMSSTWTVVDVICSHGRMLSVMAHFRCEEMPAMCYLGGGRREHSDRRDLPGLGTEELAVVLAYGWMVPNAGANTASSCSVAVIEWKWCLAPAGTSIRSPTVTVRSVPAIAMIPSPAMTS